MEESYDRLTLATALVRAMEKRRSPSGDLLFKYSVLAPSYSRLSTTIASRGLNFRVRKENGCDPSDEAPEQDTQKTPAIGNRRTTRTNQQDRKTHATLVIPGPCMRYGLQAREFCRHISTPRLKALLPFHLVPINVVISHESQRFLILESASRLDAFSGYPIPT